MTLVVTYIGAPLDPEQTQEIDDTTRHVVLYYRGRFLSCRYRSIVAVDYGSCTHYDTLEEYKAWHGPPTERRSKIT